MSIPLNEFIARYYEEGGTVVWREDGTGEYTAPCGRKTVVYQPARAIADHLGRYAVWAVQEFARVREKCEELGDRRVFTYNHGLTPAATVCRAEGQNTRIYSFGRADATLRRMAVEFVTRKASALTETEDSSTLTNAEFLLSVGIKRDYKNGCAMCHTDKIIGTSCRCGHTEVAVFVPCGHAACVNPCYDLFAAWAGVRLRDRVTRDANGQEWLDPGKLELVVLDKPCPLCQQRTERVFRAEEIELPPKWLPEIAAIANDLAGKVIWK